MGTQENLHLRVDFSAKVTITQEIKIPAKISTYVKLPLPLFLIELGLTPSSRLSLVLVVFLVILILDLDKENNDDWLGFTYAALI